MIDIKTTDEIKRMEVAGQTVAKVHKAMKEMIAPGVTLRKLDAEAKRIIEENDCTPSFLGYGGFPGSICASVNDVVVHGIPDARPLKNGDIVSIDVGACYKGYHGDAAFTMVVGTTRNTRIMMLLKVCEEALYKGIEKAKPGARLGDVSNAIGEHIRTAKLGIPQNYAGHGIGSELHMEPMVHNEGIKGTGPTLTEGMTIAIEPMAHLGKDDTKVEKDNWTVKTVDGSLAAHFEHTVVITKNGAKILTKLPEGEE